VVIWENAYEAISNFAITRPFLYSLPENSTGDVNLALVGFEAISVAVILIVVFLWGPQKLPEMARSVALARREFEKASKEMTSPSGYSPPSTSIQSPTASSPEPLIIAAKALGISTEGKTKEQIAKEITGRTT
jgi:sec-independent protein translocase protein TatA